LDDETLRIEVEDICFLMGLSLQGEMVILKEDSRADATGTITYYIDAYCDVCTHKVSDQVPI
jgi:hypothetical protein